MKNNLRSYLPLCTYSILRYFYLFFFISLFFNSCGTNPNFPSTLTSQYLESQEAKKFYRIYGSILPLPDGSYTKSNGKVLFLKRDGGIEVAFYYPKEHNYIIASNPEFIENTTGAVATNHPNKEIPGVYYLHNKGEKLYYIYLDKGNVTVENFHLESN